MKISVKSSRRDELIRQRDEWDSEDLKLRTQHNEQRMTHMKKEKEVCNAVADEVSSLLSGVNLEGMQVVVEPTWSMSNRGVEVKVDCGDNIGSRTENSALRWSWTVSLDDDGNAKKKTSSWSGLEATTKAQINQLKETVNALEILEGIDWNHMLNVTLPEYDDYITVRERKPNRPNFESDIFDEELKELIGSNTLVKGMFKPDPDRGRYDIGMKKGHYQYYLILRDSGSQYTVAEYPRPSIETPENYSGGRWTLAEIVDRGRDVTYRIRKDTFQKMLFKPLETVEVTEEIVE
jgi:hypothetical protein